MLEVQKYLIENSISKLIENYSIKVREYDNYGIIILNYSMIDSPKLDPIVRECRSLILENKAPYNVVSRSFDRFFNYGECPDTNKFNLNTAILWEKIDGSIINVYRYNNTWNISTRSMAVGEATTPIGDNFANIFKSVVNLDVFNKYNDDNKTFIFELVSPLTRIVKPYKESDVYLLSVRCKNTGKEATLEELHNYSKELNIKLPKYYKFVDYDSIVASFKDIDAFDEGYVAIDFTNHHRIKIKNPSYLAIANLRENGAISEKRLVHLVFAGDTEEYLNIFPEDTDIFEPYIKAFTLLLSDIHDNYTKYKNIDNQKEFALAIKNLHYKSILFQMRKGEAVQDILDNTRAESKVDLLTYYTKYYY